jgi:hypothetical protein
MDERYATAMELLLAERPSREEVERSAALLEAASADGNPDATERWALFEAFGMARPQNWDRALDLLQRAAEQGSRSAGEQLLLLADSQADPKVPTDASDGYWRQVRAEIRLEARLDPGEKIVLSETPRIRSINGFATPAECRWIVAGARERLAPAPVFDKETGAQTHNDSRDNSFVALRIGEMNVFTEVIRNRISAATKLPVPLFEPSQVLHYAVGQRFKPHHDFLDPANPAYRESLGWFGQRIATFLIYLNDDYEGGETSFPKISLDYKARLGNALFFANVTREGAPDPQTLHAGLPPTSGEKWVFSQWIRDRFPSV